MQYIDVFTQRLLENITDDYFDIILVSSRSLGRLKGARRPYRVGKSTFALWLSYLSHRFYYEYYGNKYSDDELWDMVFKHLFYSIYNVDKYIRKLAKKKQRVPAVVLDDAERSAPAMHSLPPRLREAIYNINVYGTQVKFLIMTAPSMKDLAKPLREMITFEVIIPERGVFEIQEIVLEKDFYNAPREYGRYIYRGEGVFPPLPKDIQRRYDDWRAGLPATSIKHRGDNSNGVPSDYVQLIAVAVMLGINDRKLRTMCESGELECIKHRRKWWIKLDDIREKLAPRRRGPVYV